MNTIEEFWDKLESTKKFRWTFFLGIIGLTFTILMPATSSQSLNISIKILIFLYALGFVLIQRVRTKEDAFIKIISVVLHFIFRFLFEVVVWTFSLYLFMFSLTSIIISFENTANKFQLSEPMHGILFWIVSLFSFVLSYSIFKKVPYPLLIGIRNDLKKYVDDTFKGEGRKITPLMFYVYELFTTVSCYLVAHFIIQLFYAYKLLLLSLVNTFPSLLPLYRFIDP